MSKSSRKRGPAWSLRSVAAMRAGMPGSLKVALDMRPGGQPLEDEDIPGRQVVEDPRRHACGRGRPAVVQLVAAIDG